MRTLEAAAQRLKPDRAGARRTGRVPPPRLFLFGDPRRLPDPCGPASRLPPGAAVVARGLAPAVLARLARLARRRRLVLLVGGDGRAALRLAGRHPGLAAGLHLPDRAGTPGLAAFLLARRARGRGRALLLTATMHGQAGRGQSGGSRSGLAGSLARVRRLDADAVVLSPVFPTASHPGAPTLGPLRWAAAARCVGHGTGLPVVALGGVAPGNAARLPCWIAGFGAIAGFGG